jgi:DNA-binding response OmpR family regulator
MLPGMDGLQLISRLRSAAGVDIPILILSGCGTLPDKLNGFQCGADDYLVKPFDLPELEARLLALHRRQVGNSANTLRVADLEFDVATLTVKRAGVPLKLKPTALKLLKILMKETGRVVSRQELERTLWGSELPDSDSLRTHIAHLRSAIDKPFSNKLLHTLHGIGYRLMEPDSEKQ